MAKKFVVVKLVSYGLLATELTSHTGCMPLLVYHICLPGVFMCCVCVCVYVQVYEIGESPDPEGDGTLLGSAEEKSYTCERSKTCRLLFDKPVLLTAGRWYAAYASVNSPTGASSDAGSSGQSSVTGSDKLV